MTIEADRCQTDGPATGALLLLPGALVVYLAFNAGGFFPGATGIAAAALALVLVLRITLARDPFEGYGPRLAIAAGMLGLFGAWTLASGTAGTWFCWKDGRFDRTPALGGIPVEVRVSPAAAGLTMNGSAGTAELQAVQR